MQRIGPNGTRLTELAEAAQVTKQTASVIVDQLERRGYVERKPDASDARAKLVHVAARGEAARPIADAVIARIEAEWEAHLGARRWATLRDSLARLREITDPYL
jgi:DNA-binding MarR family transcriptional regulator